jgi:hypothetical protein
MIIMEKTFRRLKETGWFIFALTPYETHWRIVILSFSIEGWNRICSAKLERVDMRFQLSPCSLRKALIFSYIVLYQQVDLYAR